MPAYRFEAASAAGKLETGILDADSARQVRNLLRERGLTPLDVTPIESGGENRTGSVPVLVRRLRDAELALATRQLASLLSARLPLERALSAVIEQAETPLVRDRFAAVRSEVVAGQTFADALGRFPKDFPEVYRALVAAGEQTGDLGRIMSQLADHVEARTALTQKVKLAFTYPVIVTLVALAVIVALLTYVVPQVVSVFAQTRQSLPARAGILGSSSAAQSVGSSGLAPTHAGFALVRTTDPGREHCPLCLNPGDSHLQWRTPDPGPGGRRAHLVQRCLAGQCERCRESCA